MLASPSCVGHSEFAKTSIRERRESVCGTSTNAYPSITVAVDWNLATQVVQNILRQANEIKPTANLDSFQVERQQLPEPIAGLTGYRVNVSFDSTDCLTIICVHEPGIIYAAWLSMKEGSEGIPDDQYEAMRAALEQKISASHQGGAEKMKPPTTVIRSHYEGTQCRLDYEPIGHGHRFTLHVAENSFGNVFALAQQLGFDPRQILPFLQSP